MRIGIFPKVQKLVIFIIFLRLLACQKKNPASTENDHCTLLWQISQHVTAFWAGTTSQWAWGELCPTLPHSIQIQVPSPVLPNAHPQRGARRGWSRRRRGSRSVSRRSARCAGGGGGIRRAGRGPARRQRNTRTCGLGGPVGGGGLNDG